jgi:hypothetical protein
VLYPTEEKRGCATVKTPFNHPGCATAFLFLSLNSLLSTPDSNCAPQRIPLRWLQVMSDTNLLPCDGCGQFAPPAHIARRLQRLEWATRYRPVHVQTLLLGGIVPSQQSSYLYAESEQFSGESGQLLRALEISTEGKSRDAILTEFQKRGLLLGHILDCPLEGRLSSSEVLGLLERQLRSTLVKIRRSLKPKRVLLFSKELAPLLGKINESDTECPIVLDDGKPFDLSERPDSSAFTAFRQALSSGVLLHK